MFKTTESSEELVIKAFRAGNNEVVESGDSRADEIVVDSSTSKNKKSKKSTRTPNIEARRESNCLTPNAKEAFNHLKLAFIKAPILQILIWKVISKLKLMHQAIL